MRLTRNEDLRPGDVMATWFGQRTIVGIEPYTGPLAHIIFAIARLAPESVISLEIGGHSEIVGLEVA